MRRHWSQLVPNMSTDIRGHLATQPNRFRITSEKSAVSLLESGEYRYLKLTNNNIDSLYVTLK